MRPQPAVHPHHLIARNYSAVPTILSRGCGMCDPCGIPMLFETALERLVSTKKLPCPYCDEIYKLFSVRCSWRIIDLTR